MNMTKPKKKERDDCEFYYGAIWALSVLNGYGQDAIYDDVVQIIGEEGIAKAVRKMGGGTSSWFGWNLYLKRKRAR